MRRLSPFWSAVAEGAEFISAPADTAFNAAERHWQPTGYDVCESGVGAHSSLCRRTP
ncbi:MAG: hypothetical protein LBT53_03185 [Puniceicoccales bacterium]|nr:hypothetical protein [Puniceicoccales bacterium]